MRSPGALLRLSQRERSALQGEGHPGGSGGTSQGPDVAQGTGGAGPQGRGN